MFRRRLTDHVELDVLRARSSSAAGTNSRAGSTTRYTPEDVTTDARRQPEPDLSQLRDQPRPSQPGPSACTIFNSPLTREARRDEHRALRAGFVRDRPADGRSRGIRWERVEGYLPAQVHPSSEYFPTGTVIYGLNVTLNTGGVLTQYTARTSFAEVRNAPLWKNLAPRLSLTYDLSGNGRTVVKFSCGQVPRPDRHRARRDRTRTARSRSVHLERPERRPVLQKGNAVWDGSRYVGGEFGDAGQQRHDDSEPESVRHARCAGPIATRSTDRHRPRAVRRRASERDLHLPPQDVQDTVRQSVDVGRRDQWAVNASSRRRCCDHRTRGRHRGGRADRQQTITVYSLNPA